MLRVKLENFQAIKKADVVINGITFISAPNGRGKSTLFNAIKTVIENDSHEINYRHGTKAFTVDLDLDGIVLHYGRSEGKPWVSFGDESVRMKLGNQTMSLIEPRFPLKRIDYAEAHFIPNIAEQNKVPVFSDISVVDLFSTLFATVSKLSQRGTELKKEVREAATMLESVESNLTFTKAKRLEYEKLIDKENYKFPFLEQIYNKVIKTHAKKVKFAELSRRVAELSAKYTDKSKIKMVSKVEKARELFPQLLFIQKVQQTVALKTQLREGVDKAGVFVATLPPPSVDAIVSGVGSLIDAKRKLAKLRSWLVKYPPELELFTVIGEIRKIKKYIRDYYLALSQLDKEYTLVTEQLNKLGCPFLASGDCPHSKGFKHDIR